MNLNIAPSLLLVDIDLEYFNTDEEFELCVSETRSRFKELLNTQPTELWTGNGVHFILPQYAIALEEIEKFRKFDQPSGERFEEQLMTDGMADPDHSNNVAFGKCCLRIPGSQTVQRNEMKSWEYLLKQKLESVGVGMKIDHRSNH
jgi:hypothetical protein